MTSAIILFRYHKSYDVCIQTLKLFHRLNPGIAIHGLYGGSDQLENLPVELTSLLVSNWAMPLDDPYYKWKNGDLCARWWYRDHGHKIDFDHAYYLEWDMLFLKSLKTVYGDLKKDSNYGTIFGDFKYIDETRWYWINGAMGVETEELMAHLAEKNTPVNMEELSYSIMGGTVFCRKFLDQYILEPVPSYTNDEVRLTFYSSIYKILLINNNIHDNKNNIYLADNEVLTQEDLDRVIANDGAVIHPWRSMIENLEHKLSL